MMEMPHHGMFHHGHPHNGVDRVFVQVAYDFDYVAEDGSQVVMRENEILLLINKTNHDWWQVRQTDLYTTGSQHCRVRQT